MGYRCHAHRRTGMPGIACNSGIDLRLHLLLATVISGCIVAQMEEGSGKRCRAATRHGGVKKTYSEEPDRVDCELVIFSISHDCFWSLSMRYSSSINGF